MADPLGPLGPLCVIINNENNTPIGYVFSDPNNILSQLRVQNINVNQIDSYQRETANESLLYIFTISNINIQNDGDDVVIVNNNNNNPPPPPPAPAPAPAIGGIRISPLQNINQYRLPRGFIMTLLQRLINPGQAQRQLPQLSAEDKFTVNKYKDDDELGKKLDEKLKKGGKKSSSRRRPQKRNSRRKHQSRRRR